ILRALGDTEGEVELDESMREIQPGDRWLLSSDGLFGVVSRDTIHATLAEHDDPGAAADALVALSLRAGAPDNVTCVVADFLADGGAHHPMSEPQVVGSAAERPARRPGSAPSAGSPDGAVGGSAAQRAAALLAADDATETDQPRRRKGLI